MTRWADVSAPWQAALELALAAYAASRCRADHEVTKLSHYPEGCPSRAGVSRPRMAAACTPLPEAFETALPSLD